MYKNTGFTSTATCTFVITVFITGGKLENYLPNGNIGKLEYYLLLEENYYGRKIGYTTWPIKIFISLVFIVTK